MGHGGIECVSLVGMTYVSNLIIAVMINTGNFDVLVEQTAAAGTDTSALLAVKEALCDTNAGIFLLAALERILTMLLHTALSLWMCRAISQNKAFFGFLSCFILHAIVDFVSAIISGLATEYLGNTISQSMSYVLIYTFLTVVAVLSLAFCLRCKKAWKTAE
jgi:uncharacterized membrane protein YhfC